jgi:hypothetical protein
MALVPNYVQGTLTTSLVTLFTAANPLTISAIRVTNIDGVVSADATLARDPTGAPAAVNLAFGVPVPASANFRIDGPIHMKAGDTITGFASANGDLAYHIEYVEDVP